MKERLEAVSIVFAESANKGTENESLLSPLCLIYFSPDEKIRREEEEEEGVVLSQNTQTEREGTLW